MTTPPRRWFSFSLRTLVVVVTVACLWLAYQLNWIRLRHEAVANGHVSSSGQDFFNRRTNAPRRAPALLWLLGERGHPYISIESKAGFSLMLKPEDEAEQRRIQLLFPKANIQMYWSDRPKAEKNDSQATCAK